MKQLVAILAFALLPALGAAQTPLYIVNGEPRESIADIPQSNIVSFTEVAADEQSVARYGTKANNGVILVQLKFDRAARFEADAVSFDDYIAKRVEWNENQPAARVVLRYTIGTDGQITIDEILEATDNRLRRKVLDAVAAAPRWTPAENLGEKVAVEGILRVQLPAGKPMPREPYIILR